MIIDKNIFFIKKHNVCLSGAYKFFGVKKDSYMGSVVQRIYDHYCRGAINLYTTYLRYYKKEFSTYEGFLENRFNLFPNEVKRLISKRLFYKDVSFQAESNITSLMDDVSINNAVKIFLGMKERIRNED